MLADYQHHADLIILAESLYFVNILSHQYSYAIIFRMQRFKYDSSKMYCFSPPIMIATFLIEIGLAIYTIVRYKMNEMMVVILLLLTMLGLFQLGEYFVCTSGSEIWSRVGYMAITTLPALGVHLFYLLSDNKSRKVVTLVYAAMLAFAGYFLFSADVFKGYECTGNYVIFQLGSLASLLYEIYYFGLMFLSIGLSIYWLVNHPKAKSRKKLIEALIIGYLVFLIPTATVTSFFPDTRSAIPSIMCGFAVIFAIILALYIAPRALNKKA